jgi:hypothetical protein
MDASSPNSIPIFICAGSGGGTSLEKGPNPQLDALPSHATR